MGYTPSPRPTFDGPAHIPFEAATRHLWGDATAGEVADWIYVSSDKIHQLVFGLLPGAMFRHSEEYRTVFGADELFYVLSGVLALCNPETGEVRRALPGEAFNTSMLLPTSCGAISLRSRACTSQHPGRTGHGCGAW